MKIDGKQDYMGQTSQRQASMESEEE